MYARELPHAQGWFEPQLSENLVPYPIVCPKGINVSQ
jgi:hypothetical protein